MMQSPQLIHALAKQNDLVAKPRHETADAPIEKTTIRPSARSAEPKAAWFWQLLFGRGGSTAS